jgi:hypothetical protein
MRPTPSRIQQKVNREDYNFPRSLSSTRPAPIFHKHELYTFDESAKSRNLYTFDESAKQNNRMNSHMNTSNNDVNQNNRMNTFDESINQNSRMNTLNNGLNQNSFNRPILTKTRNNNFNQNPNSRCRIPNRVQHSSHLQNKKSSKPYSVSNEKPINQKKFKQQFQGYQDRNFFSINNDIKPVQNFKFKENNLNYGLQNFHSLNETFETNEINKFYDNNPTNTRRDIYEGKRNEEHEEFIRIQGGPLYNITDNKASTTRTQKTINNHYVPIKKNLAVPPSVISQH